MLIAKIEDGVVTNVADYRSMFPDTSFPSSGVDQQFLEEHECLGVTVFKPYDANTEKLVPAEPYVEDNQVFTVAVAPLTPEEIQSQTDTQATVIRTQRDALLTSCDWTQLSDAPVDKAAWATYRQELRDISNQTGFPWDVVFPKDPNYIEPVIVEPVLSAPVPEIETIIEPVLSTVTLGNISAGTVSASSLNTVNITE